MTAAAGPLEAPAPSRLPARATALLRFAAATLALAGAGHVAAAIDHRDAGRLVIGVFLASAVAQLCACAWLTRRAASPSTPDALVLGGLLAGTVALIVLYLLVHASDLVPAGLLGHSTDEVGTAAGAHQDLAIAAHPVGAESAGVEAPGVLGSATVAAEVLATAALIAVLPARWRRPAGDIVLALGALAWLLWLLGILG